MTKSMQKLAMAFIAACAVLGGIGAANAQMHGSSHAGGGGFHVVAPPTLATGFITVAGFTTMAGSTAAPRQ